MLRRCCWKHCAARPPTTVISGASFIPASATEAPAAVWSRVEQEFGDRSTFGDLPDDDVVRLLAGLPRHADELRAGLVRDTTHNKYLRRKLANGRRAHHDMLERCRWRERTTGKRMPEAEIKRWAAGFIFVGAPECDGTK
jgi:hypothetical protein